MASGRLAECRRSSEADAEVGVAKQLSENAIPLREWQDGEMSGVRGARWLPGQRGKPERQVAKLQPLTVGLRGVAGQFETGAGMGMARGVGKQ